MIQTVDVYLHQNGIKVHVGRLAYKDRKTFFEYAKEFLSSGIEISPYKLPLKAGVLECDERVFDGMFGVFADSLPDGWGKLLLDRHLMSKGISFAQITPLDRLSYVGNHGIGALTYEPVIQEINFHEEKIDLDTLATSSQNILRGTSAAMLEELLAIGGSSAGARPKIMVQINQHGEIIHGAQKLQDGFEHYMVKFPSASDSRDSGKVEYIYSLLAQKAGIKMPQTKLLQTEKGAYFAIKRFDRDAQDNRYHIHSVAGLTHSDFRLPCLDYDDLLALTMHLTKDIQEVKQMFRLGVFNLLTHNRDDHAKNFSFLLEGVVWKLSPAYDLTFSYGPGGEHSTTYLGEGKNPQLKHLEKLANKHHIKEYVEIIDEIKEALTHLESLALEYKLSDEMRSMLLKESRDKR